MAPRADRDGPPAPGCRRTGRITQIRRATESLLLRELEESDWQALYLHRADPDVARYNLQAPYTQEQTREMVRRALAARAEQPRRLYRFVIALRAEGHVIGDCRLRISDLALREGDIGYGLQPSYWGRGYATEAACALLAFGFEELGLHRIEAECHPANVASVRVLERAGMRREGHLREKYRIQGEWWDWSIYAILDHEWRAHSSPSV